MLNIDELKFDEKGLIPAIVVDAVSKKVLTLAYMNRESLAISMEKGLSCFWSRSRQELWLKGETSGNYQHIVSITADCDGDALVVMVEKDGPACHLGSDSCFSQPVWQSEDKQEFMDAPIIAPYAMTPPPMVAATELKTPRKPEEVPITMGTLPPMGPMENNWTRVTIPATSIAFCSRCSCSSANSPLAIPQVPVMISRGVRLPTNMARTCCRPRGIAWESGIFPSSWKAFSDSL